jgi:plasmid stability protein
MKNITITLDAETAAWVRIHAAEQNKSVSRLVGEILQSRMKERRDYQRAMKRCLAKAPLELDGPTAKPTLRERIYDGPRIR